MSSTPPLFVDLVKKFVKYPNPKNVENLSERLYKIVCKSLENGHEKKEKIAANQLPKDNEIIDFGEHHNLSYYYTTTCYDAYIDNIQTGSDDYHPFIYYYLFLLCGDDLKLTDKKIKIIDNHINNLTSQVLKNENDKKLNTIFTGFSCLSKALQQVKQLQPLLKKHRELEKNIYLLSEHGKKLKNKKAKKVVANLIQTLKEQSREYLGQVYYLYNVPEQANNIKEKTEKYKENMNKAINEALPILKVHRTNKAIRIIGKVMFSIASVCTLGLALVGKGMITKLETNQCTLFNNMTKKQNYANHIQKDMNKLTDAVTQVCARE